MSKFLKFQQVLSIAEAIDLLSSLTGEHVTTKIIESLCFQQRLTPILGVGSITVGFRYEHLAALSDGQSVTPVALSEIGVPSAGSGMIENSWLAAASTAEGRYLYFYKLIPDSETGAIYALESYQLEQLVPLDPFDPENWSFLTHDLYEIARQANDTCAPGRVLETTPPAIVLENGGTNDPSMVTEISGLSEPYTRNGTAAPASRQAISSEGTDPPSYRLAVAALLELISDQSKPARNQSGAIDEILTRHPNRRGLSKRNLEAIFAAANKAAKDIE